MVACIEEFVVAAVVEVVTGVAVGAVAVVTLGTASRRSLSTEDRLLVAAFESLAETKIFGVQYPFFAFVAMHISVEV
jgi:hypothetical protein